MEFRILGPLEVEAGGQTLALGGHKQRALLALLLTQANRVVSPDRLSEGLWGDTPPHTAAATIQVYVSQLRKLLEPHRDPGGAYKILISRSRGYLLRVDSNEFDLYRFEQLKAAGSSALDAGDAEAAADWFQQALGLWRGPALADFVAEAWAVGEAARLNEMRMHALERRIDADLALGRHADLVPELEALVAEHPLRERLRGQLMLAFYRSGRQAEASDVFQRTRETLVEELGMEPGPDLQKLLGQILNQDPQLNPPTPRKRAPRPQAGRLPSPLTRFVDRASDVAALRELTATNRLLTITGPGGTGKTRLALELAAELEPQFVDGALLCELASLADPALIADALVHALGLTHEATDLAAAREYLRERTTLLVLDNCEHLLPAAAESAEDLLAACPELRIISTSRSPLGVIGEAVWRLKPLPEEAAVQLFVERAEAAAPGFRLEDANTDAVATICRRLDGVPLALELAAPRLRVVSVDDLAKVVLEPAWQPRSGDRHASVDAITDWSYRLLDPDEQDLFRRLGLFAGWFEDEDAMAMSPGNAAAPVLVGGLVEKSMLIAERPAGTNRYRLLETVREFSRARLKESGEHDAARLQHAERMVTVAEQSGLVIERRFAKAAAMVDDVRAALVTLCELQPKRAAWLAGTLRWFWANSGRLVEGIHWTKLALDASPDPSLERCWALYGEAILLLRLGRLTETRLSFQEAIALTDLPECDAMRGELLIARAILHGGLSDYAAAEAADREAIEELKRIGQIHRATLVINDLATVLLYRGRFVEAQEQARVCVEGLRRSNVSQIHFAVETLAQTHAFVGDIDQARTCWLESAASLSQDGGEVIGAAVCLEGLAFAAGTRHRTEAALRLHACANHVFDEAEYHYTEPLARHVYQLMERLRAEVGPELDVRLREEGESLTIQAALQLAAAEG